MTLRKELRADIVKRAQSLGIPLPCDVGVSASGNHVIGIGVNGSGYARAVSDGCLDSGFGGPDHVAAWAIREIEKGAGYEKVTRLGRVLLGIGANAPKGGRK